MRLPKLTRILALSSLFGMFVLSIQGLQMRYITYPAHLEAARTLFAANLTTATRAGEDLKQLSGAVMSLAISMGDDEQAIAQDQTIIADMDRKRRLQSDAAKALMNIMNTTMMNKDQCLVVKNIVPCINGQHELTHKPDDASACDF